MSGANPNKVVRTNKGYIKINGIELAELKECEVTIEPNVKNLPLMNSATDAEITMSYKCTISFKFHKTYSRFKPAILAAAKSLSNFIFDFEGTNYTPDGKEEESIAITDAWIKGKTTLMKLASENDFGEDSFESGFMVENADFTNTIDDGEDWASK